MRKLSHLLCSHQLQWSLWLFRACMVAQQLCGGRRREALGAYPRGREQLHMSEWRGDQSQVSLHSAVFCLCLIFPPGHCHWAVQAVSARSWLDCRDGKEGQSLRRRLQTSRHRRSARIPAQRPRSQSWSSRCPQRLSLDAGHVSCAIPLQSITGLHSIAWKGSAATCILGCYKFEGVLC